jgi:DNA-binding response OmpR family regulator
VPTPLSYNFRMSDITARRRILVVEDEALVAMQLEDMLAELGHDIAASCARLDEAVAAARTIACDAAVLDINLSGQTSFPVAQTLKDRGVPFLFATGYGTSILPPELAGSQVLHKPYSLDDLRLALSSALA